MKKARKGEIAMALLGHILRKEGMTIGPEFGANIQRVSKETGISASELVEFTKPMLKKFLQEKLEELEIVARNTDEEEGK